MPLKHLPTSSSGRAICICDGKLTSLDAISMASRSIMLSEAHCPGCTHMRRTELTVTIEAEVLTDASVEAPWRTLPSRLVRLSSCMFNNISNPKPPSRIIRPTLASIAPANLKGKPQVSAQVNAMSGSCLPLTPASLGAELVKHHRTLLPVNFLVSKWVSPSCLGRLRKAILPKAPLICEQSVLDGQNISALKHEVKLISRTIPIS